jgi:hypothetical protein
MMERLRFRLRSDRSGYCFRFKIAENLGVFGGHAARAIMVALRMKKFSGRCEYYEADDHQTGDYLVGLGLKQSEGRETPEYDWWKSFAATVVEECQKTKGITVNTNCSGIEGIRGFRSQLLESGDAEFLNGLPLRLIDYDEDQDLSWFAREVKGLE